MEISELQNTYRSLDEVIAGYTRRLNSNYSQIKELKKQAEGYRSTAETILDRCANEDDPNRIFDMVNQARAYNSRAEACESAIPQLERQIQEIKGSIKGCRSKYETCIKEARQNIQNLTTAMNKLNAISSSYGADKIKQTVIQIKQRASANQQIANACQNRLSWIDNL